MLSMEYIQPVFPGAPGNRQRNSQQWVPRPEPLQGDAAVAAEPLPGRHVCVVQDPLVRTREFDQPSGQLLKVGLIATLLTADTVDVDSNSQP